MKANISRHTVHLIRVVGIVSYRVSILCLGCGQSGSLDLGKELHNILRSLFK